MANGNYKVSLGVDLRVGEIRERINQYNSNSNNAKLRLGIKLDTRGLAEQIRAINYKTPVKIPVRLDTKNVQSQINNIKRQIQQIGNIGINFGGVGGGGRQGIQSVRIIREVNDVTRAYRELLSLQNRMGSKQQAVAKLDTSKNAHEILELSNQIDNLYGKYQRLHSLFSGQFNPAQVDALNRNFQITSEKLSVIRQKALDAKKGLDSMSSSGTNANVSSRVNKTANELTTAYNKLRNISKNIGSIKIGLSSGLNTSKDVQQIKVLEAQLQSLTTQYHNTVAKIKGKGDLSATQWQTIQHQIDNTKLKLSQLSAKVADAKAKLAGGIKDSLNNGTFDDNLSNITTKYDNLSNKSTMLRTSIDRVRLALKDMHTAANSGNIDALISANQRYQTALKSVENQLRINTRVEKQANSVESLKQSRNAFLLETNNWLQKNSAAAAQFSSRIQELQAQVENCDRASLARLRAEFSNIKREVALTSKNTQTFTDRLRTQFQRYAAYFSVASVIMYSVQALRDMFNQVKAIDTAMVELKKVTDETDKAYNKFLTNASTRAKELGTTIDGLVQSTAGFARLGYGFEESQKLAEVANIYAVVGDEVEGVEGATKSLISTMAAFKEQQSGIGDEDFAMGIIDKFNEIGNNFAISSGGVGDALQRSASSLAAANNTLDESIALITAANTVVQNPEVVGTAFKTMSMRIRGAKSELEEAGLETEGMVESTAKLREEILALSGVDIMLDNNTFKSTYQILDELAVKWQYLTDIQQASITELIAGKRQGNVVSSLMTNFDLARDALETSLTSSGSAMKEHEKWQKSLEAQLNRLKATWQSLSQSFMSSNALKFLLNRLIGLVNTIDDVVRSFGALGAIIGGAGAFKALKTLIPAIATSFKILTVNTKHFGVAAIVAGRKFKAAFTTAFKEMAKTAAIMGIVKAFMDVASWISEAGDEAETAAEKFDKISEELSGVDSELNSLESELSGVENQIDALLAKDELTFTEQEELDRLRDVSKELERQIELTETLQKSLQKSQSDAAMGAYGTYSQDTSFYSTESKADRKEASKSLWSSVGNIVGLVVGGAIGAFAGGNVLLGAGVGSALGSALGGGAGGLISDSKYSNEITVREMLDKMHLERIKLEKAQRDAYEAHADKPTDKNKKAYEEATVALNDYTAALSNHMSQLSQYYNSIDYSSLTTDKQKEDYLKMGDDLDKYNIEMGVKGAKATALDRYFSDELITDEAEQLRLAIETALASGEDIHFYDLDEGIINSNSRLKEMGVTIEEVISYFKNLEEAQLEASNSYDAYDAVASIALLSDGVAKLTEAFQEFNETGIVSAATLVEMHEVFGKLGDDWDNYVDIMSSGIYKIEDAREATEDLAESYLGALKDSGGLKFAKLENGKLPYDPKTNKYVYDPEKYKTYLATISQLESLGVENAKEYVDALQQQVMAQDAVNQMRADAARIDILEKKEDKTEEEVGELERLKAKLDNIDGYIAEVELVYGVEIKNDGIVELEKQLSSHNDTIKKNEGYLDEITKYNYFSDVEAAKDAYAEYENLQREANSLGEKADKSVEEFGFRSFDDWLDGAKTAFDDVYGTDWFDSTRDKAEEKQKEADAQYAEYKNIIDRQKTNFDRMVEIAKDSNIGISDIVEEGFVFDAEAENANEIFDKVYNRVKPALESNIDAYGELTNELETQINDELNNLGLEIDFGRNFNKIVIENFKSSLEQLGTAMSESISGSGLSIDSMEAIENIFGGLDSFDASSLFENTANGIRLNRTEFGKLNDEFKKSNVDSLEDRMSGLKTQYQNTKNKLHTLTVGTEEYNSAIRDLSHIEAQIAANEELISQYEGVFSAYQQWQRMESSGQERDMYENLIKGFENIDDEISRGWMDDGTIEFLELLTGRELSTAGIEAQKKAYEDLDKTISKSGYSIRDFFTVDEDGNSTNAGVYNFLETIEDFEGKLGDVIKRKDGRIVGFNFEVAGGNEAVAKTLGISEELVEIMVRASDDAGFVVDVDGAVTQISYLKEQAENAVQSLVLLRDAGLKELQGVNIDFDLDADGNTLLKQQEDAFNLLEKFKKNGKIDFSMEGADKAFEVAKYLTIRLDDLTKPRYMEIDMSSVEENLRDPIKKMQDFEELSSREHLLTLTGDTEGLEDVSAEMDKIVEELAGLDNETKLKLGIDTDWTKEQISKALKNGEIEIPAQVELDIQMSEDLKDMRLMMMNQLGLVSNAEVQLKVGYDVDDSVVNELTEEEKEVMVKYLADGGEIEKFDEWLNNRKNIEIIAETFGVEDVEELALKFEGLEGLDGTTIQAIAEAIGKGDVEALQSTIEGLDGNVVQAIAEALGYGDVEALKSAINGMQGNTVDAVANVEGQTEVETLQSSILGLTGKTVDVVVNFVKNGWNTVKGWFSGGEEGGSGANGTAYANGTTGRAFKQGSWGTKNSGTALVGELGRETLVRDGRYYTIGDSGAEFIKYRKGDIIFNHRQTEELFANGKVTSGGGRAKAFANGTAFAVGSSGFGGGLRKVVHSFAVDGASGKIKTETEAETASTGAKADDAALDKVTSSSSSSSSKEFEESFDWIEVAISRIERAIDNLDQKASNIYKSWSDRNSALTQEIGKVREEIELQEDAAQRYLQEANSVGLSSSYAEKVRNGTINIEDFKGEGDEKLVEKIKDYQTWYEKYLDCIDAAEELRETEAKLYAQRVENVATQYEGILGVIEHEKSVLDEYIAQSEANAQLISADYYNALATNERSNLTKLEEQKTKMLAEMQAAMDSGTITEGSEAWYDMAASIDEVTLAIAESNTQLLEYAQTIQQLSWERFDLLQEKISSVTEETEFLIELMSSDKLYDDNGQLTDSGMATMGQHGVAYNTYMYQAELASAEAARLKSELAKDPFDTELEERYREMVSLQQEHILAAQGEKEAIREMVEEGINLELDALQERIDKYNEAIDSQKDLYDYQNKVKEQTEEIASLEKQMASYAGDTSEEAKAKIQELKVSLDDAKSELEESEYDKRISDQQQLLDELYLEYETILNTRLDNLDALVSDMIVEINTSASSIGTTLSEKADSVGYTLSESMNTIWDSNSTKINGVIADYGGKFMTAQTTTNNALNTINTNLQNVISQLNSIAKTKVKSASVSSVASPNNTDLKKEPQKPQQPQPPTSPTIKVGGKIDAGNAQIYDYAGDKSGERQYYRSDPKYKVLKAEGNWLQVRWHKLTSGITGWFKKSDVKALATGAKRIDANDMAWTQERGREYIVRPSDGAILTPVAKGDSVLNATASSNIWDMANSPTEFIRDNLKLNAASVPNNSNVQSNYTQHLDNVVFSFPNVKNYDDMLSAMQKDKNFERLILSMSIDRIAGKSGLAKGKSIR